MDHSAARAALGGFIIGYAAAIVFTAFGAIMLVRLRRRFRILEYAIGPTLSPIMVAVPLTLIAMLVWTAIGMGFGLLFYLLESTTPGGGLGSPNFAFTMVILATGLLPATPWLFLLRQVRLQLGLALIFYLALFGWALPHLIG